MHAAIGQADNYSVPAEHLEGQLRSLSNDQPMELQGAGESASQCHRKLDSCLNGVRVFQMVQPTLVLLLMNLVVICRD